MTTMVIEAQNHQSCAFPPTRWSLVLAASETDTEMGQKALGDLLTKYNGALVAYVEKKFFNSNEEAKDIVQEFILQIVLKCNLLNKVQPVKGHQFRRFLLCSLHTFTISEYRRKTALKRMPENGFQPLEHLVEMDAQSPALEHTHEFDASWARSIISEALRLMEEECNATARPDIWGVFDNRLRKPLLDGVPPLSYEDLIAQYGLKSPAHAHNILVTGKRAFVRALEHVVGDYITGKQSITEEIQELQKILSSMR